MKIHKWDSIPAEQLNPLFSRRVIHSKSVTAAQIHLLKSAVVPLHSHINEQMSFLQSGRMRVVVGAEECIMEAGDILEIPPSVPHLVEALEECIVLDIFTPVREDWIKGDDAYLRK